MECYPSQTDSTAVSLPDQDNSTILAFKRVINDLDANAGAGAMTASRHQPHPRPAAFNNAGPPAINDLEIAGWSHKPVSSFEAFHNTSPGMPLLSSECCSCQGDYKSKPDVGCMQPQNAPGLLPFVAGSIGVWTLSDVGLTLPCLSTDPPYMPSCSPGRYPFLHPCHGGHPIYEVFLFCSRRVCVWRVCTVHPTLLPVVCLPWPVPLHFQYYGEQDQWPKTVAQYGQVRAAIAVLLCQCSASRVVQFCRHEISMVARGRYCCGEQLSFPWLRLLFVT